MGYTYPNCSKYLGTKQRQCEKQELDYHKLGIASGEDIKGHEQEGYMWGTSVTFYSIDMGDSYTKFFPPNFKMKSTLV